MSDVWKDDSKSYHVIIIGDLHLSLTPPAARAESDWLAVQERYLRQVVNKAEELDLPVICTGDVFDTWDPPAELINFTIEVFSDFPNDFYSIPGNHDLPNGDYSQIKRSGYHTLCEAGVIRNLPNQKKIRLDAGWDVVGFPTDPDWVGNYSLGKRSLAVVHGYCWAEGASHPGAEPRNHAREFQKRYKGFNTVVVGDNHTPLWWRGTLDRPHVHGNGTFIRRKSDEKSITPGMGLLWDYKHLTGIDLLPFDTSEDQFCEDVKVPDSDVVNSEELVELIRRMGDDALNFKEAVRRHAQTSAVPEEVRACLLKWLKG